jgi:archaemetzincin
MRYLFFFLSFLLVCCQSDEREVYFESVAQNDIAVSKPKRGEWLDAHHENGQAFDQFVQSKPVKPTAGKQTIYLIPIGKFTALQRGQITLVQDYLEKFFQLPVKVLDDIPDDAVPKNARRIGNEGNEQLLAGYVLDPVLIGRKPKDAIVMMGISELDLYPKPEWNYVFGLASYRDKVGVSSIFRMQDGQLTDANFDLCLARLLKVCSHEIGHMFGLRHCIDADCVMNGTNHLDETDAHTTRLCSHCQRKLNHSIAYDNTKRLAALLQYFKKNGLADESSVLQKDWDAID